MLESQPDELCGLRQIAVTCAVFHVVLTARHVWFLEVVLSYSCITTKILHAFLFCPNRHMPRPSHSA